MGIKPQNDMQETIYERTIKACKGKKARVTRDGKRGIQTKNDMENNTSI